MSSMTILATYTPPPCSKGCSLRFGVKHRDISHTADASCLRILRLYWGFRHYFMLMAKPILNDPDALDELHKLSDRTPD